ncbi:MFS transporter [Streptomyces sp. R21]|uniref:MFS transporter n=1 Tax=Streptomyces sp. R21 TaxID=3238627 RepID=A0AB39NYA0_9ACTN
MKWGLPARGPGRWLAAGSFAGAAGLGSVVPFTAVYFTRSVGLGSGAVGLGMSLGSALAVAVLAPAGRLADRVGARVLSIVVSLVAAASMACFLLVNSYGEFLVVACLVTVGLGVRRVAENTLIGQLMDQDSRVEFKAYQRSVYNLGFAVGTLGAAVPLQMGTQAAYAGLITGGALLTATVALTTFRLPSTAFPSAKPSVPATARLQHRFGGRGPRDGPYLAVALLSGLLVVRNSVLTIAVPLWVLGHTDAPPSTAALVIGLNTAMVVLLQVSASRRVDSPRAAVRVNTRGALALLVGCLLYGAAGQLPLVHTVVVLVLATVCFTYGEMWTSAAGWCFAYDLADPRAPGAYQGIFGMGTGVADIVGPVTATSVVVALGIPGWAAVGVCFVVAALLTGPVVERCLRRRAPAHRPHQASSADCEASP